MTDLVELLAALRNEGQLDALLDAIPYMRTLGLSAEVRDGDVVARLPGAEALIGNPMLPALHGGVVGAMLEATAILKVLREHDARAVPKTITLTVDYLRSARVVETWARATITRLGRRVANVQVQAWQDVEDRPIAVAHCHFLLQPDPA
jgi:uncharacterized protein (TIGR00369 family)